MVASADQPLLLPLTGSLYVKGKVASTDQLLVNIGTDYYVEVRMPLPLPTRTPCHHVVALTGPDERRHSVVNPLQGRSASSC